MRVGAGLAVGGSLALAAYVALACRWWWQRRQRGVASAAAASPGTVKVLHSWRVRSSRRLKMSGLKMSGLNMSTNATEL